MNGSVSVRRFALVAVLAVLVLTGLARPLPAANDAPFKYAGTVEFVGQDRQYLVFAHEGRANHLGPCIGIGLTLPNGPDRQALVTLENGQGDSIDFFMEWRSDRMTGEGIGVYAIIGGTGRFAGATGSGSLHIVPGEGLFLDGTISY